jgi:hypothetical protein
MDTEHSQAHLAQYLASGAIVLHEEFLDELIKLPTDYAQLFDVVNDQTSTIRRVMQDSYYTKGGV